MTVKELKEYLVDKDDNLKVMIESTFGEYCPVGATKLETNHYSQILIRT